MRPQTAARHASPAIALSLGGGGVRGIAHVVAIEALDEMGVGLGAIVGSSVGAVVGALRAAGVTGAELRAMVLDLSRSRAGLVATLLEAGALGLGFGRPRGWSPVDGRRLLAALLPAGLPACIENLEIPLGVVATDLEAESAATFWEGPLLDALAASSAIPGLMRPVRIAGRVYVDGAVLDPVPVRRRPNCRLPVLAVDLTGEPAALGARLPHAVSSATRSAQMMLRAIAAARLARSAPDAVLRPAVHHWRSTEFHRSREVLLALDPFKDEVKRAADALLLEAAHA